MRIGLPCSQLLTQTLPLGTPNMWSGFCGSDWVGIIGLAIGVLGAVPTVLFFRDRWGGRWPLRRLLDLDSTQRIEILVTSSITSVSSIGSDIKHKRAIRSLVPSGDLAGVAELSAMLSNAYPRKSLIVVPSSATTVIPAGDHFVVGGPAHNNYAAQLIEGRLKTAGKNPELIFDAIHRYIKFGHKEYGPDLDLDFIENIPRVDYGIVMLTRVARGSEKVRVLLVGGLTTFGTHASAYFAAHQMADYLKRIDRAKSPNVCILIKSNFVNGQPYRIEPLGVVSEDLLPN